MAAARDTRLLVPDAPLMAAGLRHVAWITADGEIEELDHRRAAARLAAGSGGAPPVLCHAPAIARRLGIGAFAALDLLELFAFVRPARFCLPTPRGLAVALELAPPQGLIGEARALGAAMHKLLSALAEGDDEGQAAAIARSMAGGRWGWGPAVLAALGLEVDATPAPGSASGLDVWRRLTEWTEQAPSPPAGQLAVEPSEARARLAELLADGEAEDRPQQADYASAVTPAFRPREQPDAPVMVLAEAGTGVGKTQGYIAPASVWAEKNDGAVWLSTYTRNLQHQIDGELDRLYPDPIEKARGVVLRKGRENYLCLLNLEEAVRAIAVRPNDAVALGLVARWAERSRDGDMVGGDFPAWLAQIAGWGRSMGLRDSRGECIYSACPHYHKCFVERSVRRARRARIVVANHALVMVNAAIGGLDDAYLPSRYVFDEGQHLFDAADGAFSAHLSGQETAELRRWLVGAEARRASRVRGLERRLGDLVAGDEIAEKALREALTAARALPGEGWPARLAEARPHGPAERLLHLIREQAYARAPGRDSPYGLEADTEAPVPGLVEAATALDRALHRLARSLARLRGRLQAKLDDEAETLDSATRVRIEAACRALNRRGDLMVGAWRAMLAALADATPPEFVDWFAVDRLDGRDVDVGMHRHWVDPTLPFADAVVARAHGVLVTSATLTDGSGDVEADWRVAEARTGARHLPRPAIRAAVPSPYDYAKQTRVLVVGDVRKDDLDQVAAAYRALMLAAGGGGLGLFTAIARLRAVHARIAGALDAAGIPLIAQHVDGMDTATLIEIFRAEDEACLLGTDAVRDGVDVPGRSLRLIVFDRVPWPRPDILHRARRQAFGGRRYDDMIARLRLKQAFGRLIRRADDHGVFVLLDPMMPSRLAGAFPDTVEVRRLGLAEAVRITRDFLGPKSSATLR
jgi:ATP-dependent DNA helicase DinG